MKAFLIFAVITMIFHDTLASSSNSDREVAVQLKGSFTAATDITRACSDNFQFNFRSSLDDMATRITSGLRQGRLTGCSTDVLVSADTLQLYTVGKQVGVIFTFNLKSGPSSILNEPPAEQCKTAIIDFVQQVINWQSPLVANVAYCPVLKFDAEKFVTL